MGEEKWGRAELSESGMHDPPGRQEARRRPLCEIGESRQPQWARLEAHGEDILRHPTPLGKWAWPYHTILVLCCSDGCLDVEDVTVGPNQHGGTCVQDGLTATITGHHHAIDSNPAECREDSLVVSPASSPIPGPSRPPLPGSSGRGGGQA